MEKRTLVDIDRLIRYHNNLKVVLETAATDAKDYADDLVKNEDGSVKFDDKGAAADAQAAAIEAAAADATTKANDAQAAAIEAAAADATSKANTAAADAKTYADGLATNYDAAGTAAGFNTAMDERVLKLEAIDHNELVANAIAAVVAGAESDFDTLEEVADWIKNDKTGAAALQATVSEHTDIIKTINSDIDTLETNKQDKISNLASIEAGAAAGATALQPDDLQYAEDSDIDELFQ